MGLIELDKELATAVKTSLENIKAEIQTNLDSAPTSLKEINPNSSEFIIKEKKKVNFTELFEVYTKEYVVITFLSILAMTRKQEIEIEQENNFKNI